MIKLNKTSQGLYELFLWGTNKEVPRGIETSCVVLSKEKIIELREFLIDFDE